MITIFKVVATQGHVHKQGCFYPEVSHIDWKYWLCRCSTYSSRACDISTYTSTDGTMVIRLFQLFFAYQVKCAFGKWGQESPATGKYPVFWCQQSTAQTLITVAVSAAATARVHTVEVLIIAAAVLVIKGALTNWCCLRILNSQLKVCIICDVMRLV